MKKKRKKEKGKWREKKTSGGTDEAVQWEVALPIIIGWQGPEFCYACCMQHAGATAYFCMGLEIIRQTLQLGESETIYIFLL